MMKKIFWFLMLAAGFAFTACSDDNEVVYDADSAVSNYEPVLGSRKVASLHTTNVLDGREYSWKHNFTYDKHGRIKEVNSEILHHYLYSQSPTGQQYFRPCNITSNAKYYYNGEHLQIAYTEDWQFPTYPAWNKSESHVDAGVLNDYGYIESYYVSQGVGFECEYNLASLKSVAYEGGYLFDILRDARGNVNGHKFTGYDREGNDSISNKPGRYAYTGYRNKTNFDFSAYLGYWENERYINALSSWPYATYQLAAFGFFGSGSENLPLCQAPLPEGWSASSSWVLDSEGFPVKYTDPDGRETKITYVEE